MKHLNTILLGLISLAIVFITFWLTSHIFVLNKPQEQYQQENIPNVVSSGFLYTNPADKVPESTFIDYQTMVGTYFIKIGEYYGGTPQLSNYICKSTGKTPEINMFFKEKVQTTCTAVGCGGYYTRQAIVCGNQYFIEEFVGTYKWYGPFALQ